ncbi:hypothetical protein [Mesorhizobium sp. M0220]|uniref:hypothetical protein n=1 Tax=unclassified Mesorhizobium TaxID=325217 RepID=UPI0033351953
MSRQRRQRLDELPARQALQQPKPPVPDCGAILRAADAHQITFHRSGGPRQGYCQRNRRRATIDAQGFFLAENKSCRQAFQHAGRRCRRPQCNDIVIPQDHDASPLREEEYFVVCPACGQAFDIRCMAEALHHNELGHEPYDLDS